MNALKWSEGFLGDNLSIEANCKYEEPMWSIVMDADYPKLSILEQGGRFYNGVVYPTFAESKSQHYKTQSPKAYPCGYGVNIPSSPRREELTPFNKADPFKNL